MTNIFITAENADLTEGRGPMRATGLYSSLQTAVEMVKGRGVQGVGDGEVYVAQVDTNSHTGLTHSSRKVYGYRQHNGVWSEGYVYDHAVVEQLGIKPEEADPEYIEYLRLKDKFE